ncbi:MAG: response regulator [bacterium]
MSQVKTNKKPSKKRLAKRVSQPTHQDNLAIVGNIVGGTAHTFNNILGGILGYSQLLLQQLEPSSRSFRQASIIEKAAKRATKLTSQLHFWSNPVFPFQKSIVEPGRFIDEVLSTVQPSLAENILLVVRLDHQSYNMTADIHWLSKAIINIIINAAEAMPEGGKLTLRTFVSKAPKVTAKSFEKYIIFRISDTGVGIKTQHLSHIFEPYFRHEKSGAHLGLGLTMAQAIVMYHGGHISVKSQVGAGSLFDVYLPVVKKKLPVHNVKNKGGHVLSDEKVILVVDDENDLRTLAKTIFERKGYKVLLAENGHDAVRVFRKHADKIQLIILDLILPGMDPSEVYQKLREVKDEQKMILTSGYNEESPTLHFLKDCDDYFISKPWDVPRLVERVHELVDDD